MHSINPNQASSQIQKALNDSIGQINQNNKTNNKFVPVTDSGAYNITPEIFGNGLNIDLLMGNVANFNDTLSTAQDTLSLMRAQGEALLNLINKAHDEEHSPEEIEGMNAEASSRVAEINRLFESADFNGINPLKSIFGVTIPNFQDFLPKVSENEENEETEETNNTNPIANLIADMDFNIDIQADFGGSSLNLTTSAKVQIGYTDDGALQINVDATMDFDLSGVIEKGVESDSSKDIVNNFLNLLSGNQNDINTASAFLQKIMESVGLSLDEFITEEGTSSQLKGKIAQQASITLDNAPFQIPNISINML